MLAQRGGSIARGAGTTAGSIQRDQLRTRDRLRTPDQLRTQDRLHTKDQLRDRDRLHTKDQMRTRDPQQTKDQLRKQDQLQNRTKQNSGQGQQVPIPELLTTASRSAVAQPTRINFAISNRTGQATRLAMCSRTGSRSSSRTGIRNGTKRSGSERQPSPSSLTSAHGMPRASSASVSGHDLLNVR